MTTEDSPLTIDFRIRAFPMVIGGTSILDKPQVDGYGCRTGVRLFKVPSTFDFHDLVAFQSEA